MLKHYIGWLLSLAARRRSSLFKALALAEDGFLYLFVIPWLLVRAVERAGAAVLFQSPELFDRWLACFFLTSGLAWLVWAAWAQAIHGGGTPHVAAPPLRLVESGPYRLCRHPIQLGIMNYYLGLGAALAGAAVGLALYALSFLCGSLYHRLVEEKELLARFGAQYEAYRKRTPFLVPRLSNSAD